MFRTLLLVLLVFSLLVAGLILPTAVANGLLVAAGLVAAAVIFRSLQVDALVAALFSAVCVTGWLVVAG